MIKCPICNKEYTTIGEVTACLQAHETTEKAKKEVEEMKFDQKIVDEAFEYLKEVVAEYNEKYGNTYSVSLNANYTKETPTSKTTSSSKHTYGGSLEDFLKKNLDIEDSKCKCDSKCKSKTKKSFSEIADMSEKEALAYLDSLSASDRLNLLHEGFDTLLSNLMS